MAELPKIAQHKIVNEIYEAALRQPQLRKRKYLGMSEIGKPCSRALWYGFRGYQPIQPDGRIKILFELGDIIEDRLVYYLTKAGYIIEDQQREFSAHNGFFQGHWDGKILGVSSKPHVFEAKSANKKKFESFQKFGVRKTYPAYYSQCQCYMGYSGLERALVVVYCKDTSEIYTEKIYFDQLDFEFLHGRAFEIITANQAPEKINNKFECQWCSQRITCLYPENAMSNFVCGTCYFMDWKKGTIDPWCWHPDHNYKIKQWGIGCDDWVDQYKKETINIEKVPQ